MTTNGRWKIEPTVAIAIVLQLLIFGAMWGAGMHRLGEVERAITHMSEKVYTKEQIEFFRIEAEKEHQRIWGAIRPAAAAERKK